MDPLLVAADAEEKEKKLKRIEQVKSQAMSFASRVKPFFIEVRYVKDTFWGPRPGDLGMINASMIEQYGSLFLEKGQYGTWVRFVFGEGIRLMDTMDEFQAKLEAAIAEAYG